MDVPLLKAGKILEGPTLRKEEEEKNPFYLGFAQFKMPIWHSRRNVKYVAEKIRDKMWEREIRIMHGYI